MWSKRPSLVVGKNAKRYDNIVVAPEQFCRECGRRISKFERKKVKFFKKQAFVINNLDSCEKDVRTLCSTFDGLGYKLKLIENNVSCEKVKFFKKQAFVINNLDSCEKDVRTLCGILDELGYNSRLIENNVTYEKLLDQIDGKSQSTLVFFFGYGLGGSGVMNHYICLDDNTPLSGYDIAKIFSFDCTRSIAIFTNCWVTTSVTSSSDLAEINVPGDWYELHHLLIGVNGVFRKSLFLTAVIDELEKFAKSEELQTMSFMCFIKECLHHVRRNENDDDENEYIFNCLVSRSTKDFILTKS